MRIDIVTIFPEYCAPLHLSLVGRAVAAGTIDLRVHDLRDATDDPHRTVDDAPFGGGPGMLMTPEPWGRVLDTIVDSGTGSAPTLVIPTPSGRPFTQAVATSWAEHPWLVFACGRYEGIDGRVAEHYARRPDWAGVAEVSVGDFVLAGGEVAALVFVEAVARLLPGVLSNADSAEQDSFSGLLDGAVEGPQFTRPRLWRGLPVPDVLLNGDHAAIAAWRREMSSARTRSVRPDLAARSGDASGQSGAMTDVAG